MVSRTRRTDEFVPVPEFIRRFAKNNRLKIASVTNYQFENISRDQGFIVSFGGRGLLNFVNDSIYDHSRFAGETRLIEENKINYSTTYSASGTLDGKKITMSVGVWRSNERTPAGWGKTKEGTERSGSQDYWFYTRAKR